MSKIIELFGIPTANAEQVNWQEVCSLQRCPYLGRRCIKVRKSNPEISIGSCTVNYGLIPKPIIICPFRLLERRQVFTDCLHLLTLHEPGNELHVIPEISVPGGNIDYFLVSANGKKIRDFVGIELQTLDTTGTVWPDRQRFLMEQGLEVNQADADSSKGFGMNWKMTSKTILVQLHHKIGTFENLNKHLVLVIQDNLMDYMKREFRFDHLNTGLLGDSMHIHSYSLKSDESDLYSLKLNGRYSTDEDGIAASLGLQVSAKVELEILVQQLEAKMSNKTLLTL